MIIPINLCFAYQGTPKSDGSIPPMVVATDGASGQVWTLPQSESAPWRFDQAKSLLIAAEVRQRQHIVSQHWLMGYPGAHSRAGPAADTPPPPASPALPLPVDAATTKS